MESMASLWAGVREAQRSRVWGFGFFELLGFWGFGGLLGAFGLYGFRVVGLLGIRIVGFSGFWVLGSKF